MFGLFSRRPIAKAEQAVLPDPVVAAPSPDLAALAAEILHLKQSLASLRGDVAALCARFDRIEGAAEAVADAAALRRAAARADQDWRQTALSLERRLKALEERAS